jgi:hypothetical protein
MSSSVSLTRVAAACLAVLIPALAFGCAGAPDGLQVGDRAPRFELPAVGGERVALGDYTGQRPVLLFFHMAVG